MKIETISVVNLEKYQPNYKDGRKLLWIRWDISALDDYKIVKLPAEGRWLFLVLTCLATEHQNNVPADIDWLNHKSGIEKKHISKLLLVLQELGLVVTECDKMSPTYRHTDIQTNRHNVEFLPEIETIISDLNLLLGTKYSSNSKNTIKLITVNLKAGFTIENFKTVNRKKFEEWKDDEKMSKFLRPETLYGSKFEGYLNQKESKLKPAKKEVIIS